jgi:hypothetical protein
MARSGVHAQVVPSFVDLGIGQRHIRHQMVPGQGHAWNRWQSSSFNSGIAG